jgi:hypothetical protein
MKNDNYRTPCEHYGKGVCGDDERCDGYGNLIVRRRNNSYKHSRAVKSVCLSRGKESILVAAVKE